MVFLLCAATNFLEKKNLLPTIYKNQAHEGDEIEIISCRPLSKTKRWTLIGVRA